MTQAIEVRLRGALLLGAGRSREIHDATLRRPDGAPYIPASALKGSIREQLVRLMSGDGEDGEAVARRILGGQGFSQEFDVQGNLPAGEVEERAGGGSTLVYLGDAELVQPVAATFSNGLGYTVRAQVSIDRRGRRAADKRLFQRQVVGSPGEPLLFRAPADLSLLAGEDRRRFEAAVRAVFALGSSRSRGLGWVELALVSAAEAEENARRPIAVPEASELDVEFEALEPLSLGQLPFVGNFQPTLDYLAASTVRGAVVTAAMRGRGVTTDQRSDPAFKSLVLDPDTCVRFGDAMPLDDAGARPRIAPLSARIGKHEGEAAAVEDTLVRAYVQQLLADRGVFRPVRDEVVGKAGKVERAARPGRWLGAGVPARRVMTRLALDRASARGKDGALYSVDLLERKTRFVAAVSNAGPEAWQLLADAAAVDLRAGHGRGQGYGRLRIVAVRPRQNEPLAARIEDLDAYVRAKVAAAGERPPGEGRYLAALLVTELIPGKAAPAAAEHAFHAALALPGSRLLHAEVRAGQRGGFDTAEGRPRPFVPVVRAGSVLLLSVPAFDAQTLERLETLERHGAGEDRDRGFGAVRFSDPIHLKGESQ